MVREKSTEKQDDGADETMLGGDEKEQLAQKDAVKFISSEHPNGDAKIDIGDVDKVSHERASGLNHQPERVMNVKVHTFTT